MCCVVQEPSAKFGQHAGNVELSVHNEEWISVCVIICIILSVYFSVCHVQ